MNTLNFVFINNILNFVFINNIQLIRSLFVYYSYYFVLFFMYIIKIIFNIFLMKDYICVLCGKDLLNSKRFYEHTKRNKNPCIQNKIVVEKSDYEETTKKLEEKEKEVIDLKEKLELFKIIHEQRNQIEYQNYYDLSNTNINNTIINPIGIDSLLRIPYAKHEEETLNHIPPNVFFEILNCENVKDTIPQLMKAIYFNPKAPENCRWAIFDKKAKNGAFEYNHYTDGIVVQNSEYTIEQNVQSVLSKVIQILDTLKKAHGFTPHQQLNYNKIYDLFGSYMNQTVLKDVKTMAYNNSGLPKSFWKHMKLQMLN
jgi:hypothetical protein